MSDTRSDTKSSVQLRKVLAVDNDPIMLNFLSRILEKAGLQVVTAVDGVTAIDILETYMPDLFLIDLVMPNIDGRALCRIIRNKKKFKTTPIVIISAIAAEEAIDRVKPVGKPDAVAPHVRFDERGWETELKCHRAHPRLYCLYDRKQF